MRRPIMVCIMSLLALSIALPAVANLVPVAGVPPSIQSTPVPAPDPSPGPSPIPMAAIENTLSNPLVISSNTALDPVTAATINNSMTGMAWTPVLSSDVSPFQDVKSLGGASVGVQPIDQILNSIMSTIPLGAIMSDDMGWSF